MPRPGDSIPCGPLRVAGITRMPLLHCRIGMDCHTFFDDVQHALYSQRGSSTCRLSSRCSCQCNSDSGQLAVELQSALACILCPLQQRIHACDFLDETTISRTFRCLFKPLPASLKRESPFSLRRLLNSCSLRIIGADCPEARFLSTTAE